MQLYLLIFCLELIRTHRSVCLSAQTQATLSGVFSSRVVKNTDHEMKTHSSAGAHKHSHRNRYFCWIPLATISHCCGSSLVWMCVCARHTNNTLTIAFTQPWSSRKILLFTTHNWLSEYETRPTHTHTHVQRYRMSKGSLLQFVVVVVVVTADRVRAEIKLDWNFNAPI